MLQTRSCDQTCDQDQAMVQNMTRYQVRLGSGSVQQQDGSAELVKNRFGLTRGNGQNILNSFAEQIGSSSGISVECFARRDSERPRPVSFFSPILIPKYPHLFMNDSLTAEDSVCINHFLRMVEKPPPYRVPVLCILRTRGHLLPRQEYRQADQQGLSSRTGTGAEVKEHTARAGGR